MRRIYLYEGKGLLVSSCSYPAAYVICRAYVTDTFVLPTLTRPAHVIHHCAGPLATGRAGKHMFTLTSLTLVLLANLGRLGCLVEAAAVSSTIEVAARTCGLWECLVCAAVDHLLQPALSLGSVRQVSDLPTR